MFSKEQKILFRRTVQESWDLHPNDQNHRYQGPPPHGLGRALNPEGMKCEKDRQVLQITAW